MLAHLVTCRKRRRLGWLRGMDSDRFSSPTQIAANAHDRATRANAGHKRVRLFEEHFELPPNFGAGCLLVRFDVRAVRELAWEENVGGGDGAFFGHANAAVIPALLATDRTDLRAEASDYRDPLLAPPVGHKDLDWMAQSTA